MGVLRSAVMPCIGAALTVVIVAPIALSSQDLIRWAADPQGLGLEAWLAWLAFVALDAAAAVCVGMVTLAASKGETGGAFHVLTWLFAAGSATANYRHGLKTPALDDQYFFPAMSIAGPLILDVTLARVRRWARIEARTQAGALPRFGARWLPGVAFRETFAAWRCAVRDGHATPGDAVAAVRMGRAVRAATPEAAAQMARDALGPGATDHAVREWLLGHGVTGPVRVRSTQVRAEHAARPAVARPVEQAAQAPAPAQRPAPARPAIEARPTPPRAMARTAASPVRKATVTAPVTDGPSDAQILAWLDGTPVSKRSVAETMRAHDHPCGGDRAAAIAARLKGGGDTCPPTRSGKTGHGGDSTGSTQPPTSTTSGDSTRFSAEPPTDSGKTPGL